MRRRPGQDREAEPQDAAAEDPGAAPEGPDVRRGTQVARGYLGFLHSLKRTERNYLLAFLLRYGRERAL